MHLIIHMIMAAAAMGVVVLSHIHDNGVGTPDPATALTNWTSSREENASQPFPIGPGWKIPVSRVRKICQDLCSVGLGGVVCGSECLQTFLQNIRQLHISRINERPRCNYSACERYPRRRVCPILCKNGLGQPLCHCEKDLKSYHNNPIAIKFPDWNHVCEYYCQIENYQISGCGQCIKPSLTIKATIETSTFKTDESNWYEYFLSFRKQGNFHAMTKEYYQQLENLADNDPNDDMWNEWCHEKCKEQDGGAACNCNIAPF